MILDDVLILLYASLLTCHIMYTFNKWTENGFDSDDQWLTDLLALWLWILTAMIGVVDSISTQNQRLCDEYTLRI